MQGINHYNVLGVKETATHDEIKAAYRKLCLQTHPDVAEKQQSSSNAEKFKRISEAYSILGNHRERRRYDFEVSNTGLGGLRNRAAAAARPPGGGGGSGSFAAALPRNLLIGGMIGFAGVTLLRTLWPSKEEDGTLISKTGHKKLVEAWKNPQTGRWETPKPWDPVYQKLQPTLELVPRDEVHDGKR